MKDELGDRMKKNYENRSKSWLPRRTYTIIRIDGKAFHTYTKGLTRPFDQGLIDDMDATACYLCKGIQGAQFAFVQSDEISILMTDFEKIGTDAWFDGEIQKIVSVSASMATARFNQLRIIRLLKNSIGFNFDELKLAEFDARTFSIPEKQEVLNYFIWRQKDCVRNSIQSVAQSMFSHKELEGKSTNQQQEMMFQKGTNWNDFPPQVKRGRFIHREFVQMETPYISEDKCQHSYERSVWTSGECPTFTEEEQIFLYNHIPKNWE